LSVALGDEGDDCVPKFLFWSTFITMFVGLYFSTESLSISNRLQRRFSKLSGVRFPLRLFVPGAFWGLVYTFCLVAMLSLVLGFVYEYTTVDSATRVELGGMALTLPFYILAFSARDFFFSSCGFTQKYNFLTVFFILVITLLLPLIFKLKNFGDGILSLYYLSPITFYQSLVPDHFYEDEPLFGDVPIIAAARYLFGGVAVLFFALGVRVARKEGLPLVRLNR
jgi:hypothetical protein